MASRVAALCGLLASDRIGDEQRVRVLDSVARAAAQPDAALAVISCGAMPHLIACLQPSRSREVQEEACNVLGNLAMHPCAQRALVPALVPLVALLSHPDTPTRVQQPAAATLFNSVLGEGANTDFSDELYKAGAIPPLVALLTSKSQQVQEIATGTLAHMGIDRPIHMQAIIDAGAVAPLLDNVLLNGTDMAKDMVCGCINNLCCSTATRNAVFDAGAVPKVLALITAKKAPPAARISAMKALTSLASFSPQHQRATAEAGALKALAPMLKPGTSPQVAEATAAAARAISVICVEKSNKVKAAEEGLVAPLVALLKDRSIDVQVQAAGALQSLGEDMANKVSIAAAGAIPPLVKMLFSGGRGEQMAAAAALNNLVAGNMENHAAVVAMGAYENPIFRAFGTPHG